MRIVFQRQQQYCSFSVTERKMRRVSEENKVLFHTKDEYKRRGHFVRIFPSEDSWELYGYVIILIVRSQCQKLYFNCTVTL